MAITICTHCCCFILLLFLCYLLQVTDLYAQLELGLGLGLHIRGHLQMIFVRFNSVIVTLRGGGVQAMTLRKKLTFKNDGKST